MINGSQLISCIIFPMCHFRIFIDTIVSSLGGNLQGTCFYCIRSKNQYLLTHFRCYQVWESPVTGWHKFDTSNSNISQFKHLLTVVKRYNLSAKPRYFFYRKHNSSKNCILMDIRFQYSTTLIDFHLDIFMGINLFTMKYCMIHYNFSYFIHFQ